jgi:uncharacterized protein YjbI with pentapeptide repeats
MGSNEGEKGPADAPGARPQKGTRCTFGGADGDRCGRPAVEGSPDGLCQLHEPVERKDDKATVGALLSALDEGEGWFEGVHLPKVDLSGRVFHGDVSFRDATFGAGSAFTGASFTECVDLRGATFAGDVSFADATFGGTLHAGGTTFEGEARFGRATFAGEARFQNCAFGPLVDFDHARFQGDAHFEKATSMGELRLGYAEFEKYALFLDVACEGKGDFSFALFRAYADFANSRWADLNMTDVIFERRGCFDGAVLGSGTFEDAELRHVTFRDVDLSNVFTTGASLEEAYMSQARWGKTERGPLGKKLVVREETVAMEEGTRDALRRAEAAHRNLKESYKNEGDYETAGEFFIREMAVKRRIAWLDREYGYFVMSNVIAGLCGYGERPTRVIFWWFAFVFTYATIYFAGQLIAPSDGSGMDYTGWRGFLTCLYFSVVTFTTLGFGDIQPVTDAGRAVASVEAFTGAFMIALFVLVFGRKMIR